MTPENEEFKWNLGFDNDRPVDRITDRRPGRNEARYIDDADDTYELPPGLEARDVPRPSRVGRAIGSIVLLAIFAGLMLGGVYAANTLSKDAVSALIAGKLQTAFEAKSADQVEIDFGSGLFIVQAVKGTIETVNVQVAGAVVGPLTGDLTITATGVPVDQSTAAKTLGIDILLNEVNMQTLASLLSTSAKAKVSSTDGHLAVSATIKASGKSVPITVGYVPSVAKGKLVLTPETITVGKSKKEYTVKQFKDSSYAKPGKSLVKKRNLCVANLLPAALTLTDATASVGGFRLAAAGNDVRLSGAELTAPGTCA